MLSLKVTSCWRQAEGCIAVFIWAGLHAYSLSAYFWRMIDLDIYINLDIHIQINLR